LRKTTTNAVSVSSEEGQSRLLTKLALHFVQVNTQYLLFAADPCLRSKGLTMFFF